MLISWASQQPAFRFSPLSLFAASEPGLWCDFGDLSTLFQDTAGTTPVTAAGQSVARINDKSGRGNHATQATAAQRPQYQVYSKPVLNGDFVDDNITFDGSAMTACQSAYVTQNGWMVGASGSNYGSLSRIPLGRVTQYIVNPNILTNADRLSAYFGVDQYYFVGMTTDSTVFHSIDSPAGTYPITYVGANGVTYTQTANNVTTDLVAQGLTSPFTMLVPKAVLSDNQMSVFSCSSNQLTGSIPSLSANTALTLFHCPNNQLTGWSGGTVSATLGEFEAQNNLLIQTAVDAILAAFVAAGRTTGTRILNLGGTGNAAPSAAGLADKATLQSRGWTVTTN
jgi:hypothetical protein